MLCQQDFIKTVECRIGSARTRVMISGEYSFLTMPLMPRICPSMRLRRLIISFPSSACFSYSIHKYVLFPFGLCLLSLRYPVWVSFCIALYTPCGYYARIIFLNKNECLPVFGKHSCIIYYSSMDTKGNSFVRFRSISIICRRRLAAPDG